MVQMPCPELLHLGLDRRVEKGRSPSIEAEDTRIARCMAEEDSQSLCREIAASLAFQLAEYRKNGFEVAGLLGINGSPTCGVETTWFDGREQDGHGVLIRTIEAELEWKCPSVAMRGIKAYRPKEAADAVRELLDR